MTKKQKDKFEMQIREIALVAGNAIDYVVDNEFPKTAKEKLLEAHEWVNQECGIALTMLL